MKKRQTYYPLKRKKQHTKSKTGGLITLAGIILILCMFFLQPIRKEAGDFLLDSSGDTSFLDILSTSGDTSFFGTFSASEDSSSSGTSDILDNSFLSNIRAVLNQIKEELTAISGQFTAIEKLWEDLTQGQSGFGKEESYGLDQIPPYSSQPYVVINENEPAFSPEEITTTSFEEYSELDYLGRCGPAFACVGQDIMPTEERGPIGMIKPSGWKLAKYDIVDGKYLYNRCHLIGYQLTGENANEKNLITGTRYLNVTGMLPFENEVADYVKDTGNHVMYRVTPVFETGNMVASGVRMEAYSVEDQGAGVKFHVYVYNVQPGVEIDYWNGESKLKEDN